MSDYTTPGRPEGEWRNRAHYTFEDFIAGRDQLHASMTEAAWCEASEEERDLYAGWWQ